MFVSCTACCSPNPEHLCRGRGHGTWGGVDGRPHGEVLLSLSLSAHLTAAVAALPKARPQARASCGPPAGPARLPQPIRAPFLPPRAPTPPCSPVPQDAIALRPALHRAEITRLFSTVCHAVFVIGAVWGHVVLSLFILPPLLALSSGCEVFGILRGSRFQWCESIFREQERPFRVTALMRCDCQSFHLH